MLYKKINGVLIKCIGPQPYEARVILKRYDACLKRLQENKYKLPRLRTYDLNLKVWVEKHLEVFQMIAKIRMRNN